MKFFGDMFKQSKESNLLLLKKMGGFFLDVILPPLCISCKSEIISGEHVCVDCWSKLQFLSDPICEICGKPFLYAYADNYADAHASSLGGIEPTRAMCIECSGEKKHYITKNRYALIYNDTSSKLIMSLKHGDEHRGVGAFANWMSLYGKEVLSQSDIITSVPLHFNRLLYRKYNQASLLANKISHLTGMEKNNHLLLRSKDTVPQGKKSKNDRKQNVHNVFKVNDKELNSIAGKNILIVDDVYTTGSTLKECAKVLLKSGAKKIFTLTLARVK